MRSRRHLLALGFVGASASSFVVGPCACSTDEDNLMSKVDIAGYGIMGAQLRKDKKIVQSGAAPDDDIVIVDSAGHHAINPDGPSGAKGAAQSTYKWLGIASDSAYAPEVHAALHHPGQAMYKSYGSGKHVIHCFGPDLRKMPSAWNEAVEVLARTYESILREFVSSGLRELRLLPVSGGILAGEYGPQMPQLTAAALRLALKRVPEFAGTAMLPSDMMSGRKVVRMCIFSEMETAVFERAM